MIGRYGKADERNIAKAVNYAILCFLLVYLAFRGYIFDGGNLLGYYIGPIIFEVVSIIIFVTSFVGILLAWIVHGITNRRK